MTTNLFLALARGMAARRARLHSEKPSPPAPSIASTRFDGGQLVLDAAAPVIPAAWIEAAQQRWSDCPPAAWQMSCLAAVVRDDRIILSARRGSWFAAIVEANPAHDGLAAAGLIFSRMHNHCLAVIQGEAAAAIEHLKRQGQRVHAFAGSAPAIGAPRGDAALRFGDRRSACFWRFRESLDPLMGDSLALPPDPALVAELTAARLDPAMLKRGIIAIDAVGDLATAVIMAWGYGASIPESKAKPPPAMANVAYAALKRRGDQSMPTRRG